jgi:hypothetical protein
LYFIILYPQQQQHFFIVFPSCFRFTFFLVTAHIVHPTTISFFPASNIFSCFVFFILYPQQQQHFFVLFFPSCFCITFFLVMTARIVHPTTISFFLLLTARDRAQLSEQEFSNATAKQQSNSLPETDGNTSSNRNISTSP